MGVNKVVYGTTTLIDISDSTIAKNNILKGYKGYGANGDEVVGEIENVGVPVPSFIVEADDEESELMITATVTQPEGYTKGGSSFNVTYPKLTVSGDTATMSCRGASISRKVGASIATCNIKVKFTTNAGNTLTSATTFSNGAVSVFNSHTKSGEFTISNVICGSALSINTTSMCSLYWSGSQQSQMSSYGGTIIVPATAGTYTVEVGVLDD